jgi:DNA adenine methylase
VVLAGADLDVQARSWEATIKAAGAGDFVYADPPYDEEAGSDQPTLLGGPVAVRGHRYTAQGWTRGDLVRLADALARAADRGAHVLSTNNPTRFAREVFASRGFKVRVEKVTRSVSRDASTRGAVDELYAMRSP